MTNNEDKALVIKAELSKEGGKILEEMVKLLTKETPEFTLIHLFMIMHLLPPLIKLNQSFMTDKINLDKKNGNENIVVNDKFIDMIILLNNLHNQAVDILPKMLRLIVGCTHPEVEEWVKRCINIKKESQ